MVDKNKEIKVLVAMSGGVDSSVATALLVAHGYDVTGAFMVNYENEITQTGLSPADYADLKCWVGDYQDALRVAAKLGIPLMRLDFVKDYKKTVLDYMYAEYRAGRTPNPDVLCNKFIKFGAWLDKAKKLGFDKLATGHYARLHPDLTPALSSQERESNSFSFEEKVRMRSGVSLLQAKDVNKDQTYFLHQLNQEQLKHVLFPIGGYLKSEVRSLARRFGLPNADKEESMGICFVGERPMREFLRKEIKPKKGKIILSPSASATPPDPPLGKRGIPIVIGEHDGLSFYTIGQRHLGLQTTDYRLPSLAVDRSPSTVDRRRSLYVVAKNLDKNELVVGYEDDPLLYKKEIVVADINWISGQAPKLPLNCEARLRHRQPLQKCEIRLQTTDYRLQKRAVVRSPLTVVHFKTPQRAVTPGQFAVFYYKGECLGGGVINLSTANFYANKIMCYTITK